jgi:hypothetical protein
MKRTALLSLVILLTSVAFASPKPVAESALLSSDSLKPRVFLASQSKGSNRNAGRDQSMEMAKDFEDVCPSVRITINQEMADYTVILNHIEVGLFVRDNQFELADHSGDLISKTREGGSIKGGVKKICRLITDNWVTTRAQAAALAAHSANAAPAAVAPAQAAPVQVAAVQAPETQAAQFVISSNPAGADIEIDGGFVGDTPSNVDVAPGEHVIAIHKKNFKDWQRKVKVTGGSITLNAELEAAAQ